MRRRKISLKIIFLVATLSFVKIKFKKAEEKKRKKKK